MQGIGLDNTPLSAADEARFQLWLQALSRAKHGDAGRDLVDYDLRGAYAAGVQPNDMGHLPDTWKKRNHPTFSDESIYNGVEGAAGGQWIPHWPGRWDYQASPTNLQYRSATELARYFQKVEPHSRLFLPPAVHSNGIGIGY